MRLPPMHHRRRTIGDHQDTEENERILPHAQDFTMTDQVRAVEVRAEVRQIKTMADGSANVVLNVPEDCREQVKVMLDWHHLEIRAVLALDN